MKKVLLGISILVLLASCERDELPVAPHDPGEVETASVEMGVDYKWQIYFDLGTNKNVGQNIKTIWDLGFETSADGYHVVLNAAKFMYAYNTGETEFNLVTDTNGITAHHTWDEASGNVDSTAIGDWRVDNPVYIIDRGYNELGQHQGYRKVQFLSVDNSGYQVHIAKLNGTLDTTMAILKYADYNLSFLSFNGKAKLVEVEPLKDTWDLVFTQYTHIFYGEEPVTPYLVTGCILNRNGTRAILDTTAFENITFEYAQSQMLSQNINSIGYDWKVYDFDNGSYHIFTELNYIIQDAEGFYYKLHFIDFYDNQGQKGSPKFEFQKL